MQVKSMEFESNILRDNPLNDPYIRKVSVIEQENPEGKPIIVFLSGYFGSSISQLNYDPIIENLPTKLARLKKEGKITGCNIILPDMFTKLGGNQYINSNAVGLYEDFLFKELLPYFLDLYQTNKVGLMGKSSGGYGSLVLGMKYDIVSAIASHSGDAYFEYTYLPFFPKVIPYLRKFKDPLDLINTYWNKSNKKRREDLNALILIGMSAFYSPGENGEILLPFDLETGEILEDIWKKWLEKDPVRMIDKYYEKLRGKGIYLDVGNKDEFNIQYGTRILHKKMRKLGLTHYFEEFDGGHMNTSFRYDLSLAYLERQLVRK
ncbi:esterase [Candidatus Acidianus copahuensis]|uniref:S-formylglutathione hydrolase n=2 Tax=Acidianus TaxID=12914 RepID=A0A031LMV3_9CREN|nr:alpha/beta hydrolase-fold protein [Candidatus Acidianus copahuensis]EZQ04740.1 esterase [Candidatus Acidianus copahuensis]